MNKRFVKGMILYALVFSFIAGTGLFVFWRFIDAYEQSRPLNAVKAYIDQLTPEQMCEKSSALLSQLDHNIQSEAEGRDIILSSVSEDISYAKKGKESTLERQVYVLRNGEQVIGEFTIIQGEAGRFGFTNWCVSESSFDFSYLLSEPISVTVPSDFEVFINGTLLDESYISQKDIPYKALEPFYDDFVLPTLVTYTADSFLGSLSFDVQDREGNVVLLEENMDLSVLLPICSPEDEARLTTFTNHFLSAYVIYTGGANGMSPAHNYYILYDYLIPKSALANRLYTAIDGLRYAQSNGDNICSVDIHQLAVLEENRFYCDVTYIVETFGREGAVQTTNNLKLIILETDDGLKVEAMTRY